MFQGYLQFCSSTLFLTKLHGTTYAQYYSLTFSHEVNTIYRIPVISILSFD